MIGPGTVMPIGRSMGLSICREKVDKNGVNRYISKQAFGNSST